MHTRGPDAWFDSGALERDLIRKMGEPWNGKIVLEVGCGEGDLLKQLYIEGAEILGLDYSDTAISTARERHPGIAEKFISCSYRDMPYDGPDVVVMQGVLEHLDDPFAELAWMFRTWRPKTIITSSPGFLNIRGIVWHTLAAMGAVVSKTDLHYLNPWDFEWFCFTHGYKLTMESCDDNWASGPKMADDLRKRIPLALKDGGLPAMKDLEKFLGWLQVAGCIMPEHDKLGGATICYRIDR
jgi:SAM-dependent methyltransferase